MLKKRQTVQGECSDGKNDLITSITTLPQIQNRLIDVEKLMSAQADGYDPVLKAAFDVLLATGGKRIRPTIILLIGAMLDADNQATTLLAASIELLHTATLVHDDLIDGALLRRGVPTLNSQWSPAATVLTGDFMFSCAAHLVAQTDSNEIVRIFSKTLTTIVDGEINQLFASKCNLTRKDYYQRIYAKTASLFETSATTAAILGGLKAGQKESLRQFGYNLGMAFQIVDDVLDYVGSEESIGKPVGGDLRQGLITAPILFYLENHPDDPDFVGYPEGKCPKDEVKIARIIEKIARSEAIRLSLDEATHFSDAAKENIASFSPAPEKDALLDIADFIVNRKL